MRFHLRSTNRKPSFPGPNAPLRSGHSSHLEYCQRTNLAPNAICPECLLHRHTVRHLFRCPLHPTAVQPVDLWKKPCQTMEFLLSLPSLSSLLPPDPSLPLPPPLGSEKSWVRVLSGSIWLFPSKASYYSERLYELKSALIRLILVSIDKAMAELQNPYEMFNMYNYCMIMLYFLKGIRFWSSLITLSIDTKISQIHADLSSYNRSE